MTINKIRSMLYFWARVLGDVQAVKHRRIARRIVRRLAGRTTARLLWKAIS